MTITDKLRKLNHGIEEKWFTIRKWAGQHLQFLRCFLFYILTELCWILLLIRIVKCKIPVALIAWQWTCQPLHWILYKNINTDVLIHKGILGERGSQCVSGTQRRAPSKSKTLNICLGISCYFQVHLLHTILQQVSHLLSWFKFFIHKSFTISWNEKSSSILLQEPSKQSSNTDSCGNLADSYRLCIYLWQFQRHVNISLWQNQHHMNLYLWRFQSYLYLFLTICLLKVFRTVSCD